MPDPTDTSSTTEITADGGVSQVIPRWVELGSAAIFAIGGTLFIAVSSYLLTVVNRSMLTDLAERGLLRSDVLTDAVLVEVAHTLSIWGGWGLLVTGVLAVLGGVWFALSTREDGGTRVDGNPTRFTCVIIGGAAGLVLSFVPFSPALGGGIAGYIGPRRSGLATGTGAGLLAVLPALIPGVFLAVGFVLQPPWPEPAPSGAVLGGFVSVGLLLGAVFGIVAGGIGGYIGDQLASSDRGSDGRL